VDVGMNMPHLLKWAIAAAKRSNKAYSFRKMSASSFYYTVKVQNQTFENGNHLITGKMDGQKLNGKLQFNTKDHSDRMAEADYYKRTFKCQPVLLVISVIHHSDVHCIL
jgi:hypothetical protein